MQPTFKLRRNALGVAAIAILVLLLVFLGSRKHFQAEQYLQLAIDGLNGGSVYALIGLGFVVIYNVTGIVNFAQGEFVMLGAMLAVTFNDFSFPLPPVPKLILAALLAIAITTIVGIVIERVAIHPARHSPVLALIIITIGADIFLRALGLLVWGTRPGILPAFTTLSLEDLTLRWGELIIQAQYLWIWGVGAIVLVALFFFFERTLTGKALRACAINRRAAQLMGISPSRMSLLAFALAAAIGALGGVLQAPTGRPTYDMGLFLGLKGFVAAIMGGLVNLPGAVVGGLILGILESIGAGVLSSGYRDIIAFVLLIVILLVSPQGIFGGTEKGVEDAQVSH